MSATLSDTSLALPALIEPCEEAFEQVSESLRRREQLLAASAKASRLLLEAPDVMAAVPALLRLLGEAAGVDRVSLLLSRPGPGGEPYLSVMNEWTASDVVPHFAEPASCRCDERDWPELAALLRAGRSVCLSIRRGENGKSLSLEGEGTKSKAIVPILVENEFVGVVAFDNTEQQRAVDSAELSALETAAGVIGAAMHRERLIEAVRRERERAVEQRMAELARANAVIRNNLERLATEPDLTSFLGHVLVEATRQLDAAGGSVLVANDSPQEWRIIAYVADGVLSPPSVAASIPLDRSLFTDHLGKSSEPLYLDLTQQRGALWPGMNPEHDREGYLGVLLFPLAFGGRNIGFVVLAFRRADAAALRTSELLVALAHQVTLAIELTRLGQSAKRAAVLGERNRIGQEIHDGLAQAFTGILMQLSAVEGLSCRKSSRLIEVHNRIRDLAREGLSEARRSVMTMRLDQARRPGLEIALRQLAERSTVPDRIECTFEGGDIATGLRPEQEHALLRIAQEAVSNALRHAHPRNVRIAMIDDEREWSLAVRDDGCGIAPESPTSAEGFGLISMRERASAIGGEWSIESRPGSGTVVTVRLPKRTAA
jgi:signal transduction histidine kinase